MDIKLETLLLCLLPLILFLIDWVINCIIARTFWENINLGRALSLQAVTMSFLALVHFSISTKRCEYAENLINDPNLQKTILEIFESPIKAFSSGQEILFYSFVFCLFIIYVLLSFGQKIMEERTERDGARLPRKYKNQKQIVIWQYAVYVIISLYVGIISVSSVGFLYYYTGEGLVKAIWEYLSMVWMWIYGIPTALILFIWLFKIFTERPWLREKQAIDRTE